VNPQTRYWQIERTEFLAEWKHTWVRHQGCVTKGAKVFDTTPNALARRLYRLRDDGFDVTFVDDTKALRS
jgi:hypothetical protein